jgi:hypothetical protein
MTNNPHTISGKYLFILIFSFVVIVFVTPPRWCPGVGLVARGSLALAAVDSVEEVLGLLECLEALVAVAIEALD